MTKIDFWLFILVYTLIDDHWMKSHENEFGQILDEKLLLTETEWRLTLGTFVLLKWKSSLWTNFIDWFFSLRGDDMCTHAQHIFHTFVMHHKSTIVAYIRRLHHTPNHSCAMIAVKFGRSYIFLVVDGKMMAKNNLRKHIRIISNFLIERCGLLWRCCHVLMNRSMCLQFHAIEISVRPNVVPTTCVRHCIGLCWAPTLCTGRWHLTNHWLMHLGRAQVATALWSMSLELHAISPKNRHQRRSSMQSNHFLACRCWTRLTLNHRWDYSPRTEREPNYHEMIALLLRLISTCWLQAQIMNYWFLNRFTGKNINFDRVEN